MVDGHLAMAFRDRGGGGRSMSALPAAVFDDPVLLTVDEARTALVRSSLHCLTNATCNPVGLVAMLWGLPAGPTWSRQDAALAARQGQVLHAVAVCGHEWVIPYELEGIFSATGLDEGDFFGAGALVDALAEVDGDFDDALMALSTATASDSSAATAADALAWRTRRLVSRA
jgi:hypothetical protein